MTVATGVYLFRNPVWDDEWSDNFQHKCEGYLDEGDPMLKNYLESQYIMFCSGMVLGYFLLEKRPFNMTILRSVFDFGVCAVSTMALLGLDDIVKKHTDLLIYIVFTCYMRFFLGFNVGYVIPKLNHVIFKY